MTDYEKEFLFRRAKDMLDKMDEENITWNPLDKEQAGAWICGRQYETMSIITAFDLDNEYREWERKQDD